MSALSLPCIHCGHDLVDAPACEIRSAPCGVLCDECVDPHRAACDTCEGFYLAQVPHTDDTGCIRCGDSLAQSDAYSELPCGACCDWCIEAHCDSCATCREHCDADPFHNPDALPGMAAAVIAQDAAAAEQRGADLTHKLREPGADVSRITGAIESHTPLFRGSAADPQLSLF